MMRQRFVWMIVMVAIIGSVSGCSAGKLVTSSPKLSVDETTADISKVITAEPSVTALPTDISQIITAEPSVAALPTDISWKTAVNVKINSLFCDNVILQQGKSVPVWGTGTDGKIITVRFNRQIKKAKVENGTWRVNLDPMTACAVNQPLYITQDDELITVKNVLVGEVWLVSGQSNICVKMSDLNVQDQQVAKSKGRRDGLRQFLVPKMESANPLTTVESQWITCNADQVGEFSAVGYYFAAKLYQDMGIPVGIITAAVGGTYLEQWLDSKLLVKENARNPNIHIGRQSLYNGMIAPLMPFAIKGIVWYQGEANMWAEYKNATYENTFSLYLKVYRTGFEDANLPVCQVQLPIFDSVFYDPSVSMEGWKYFRYVQMGLSQHLSKVYTAVTIDCGNKDNIHPLDKEPVGSRLGLLAMEHVYGRNIQGDAPVYRSHSIAGGIITVKLDNVDKGLVVKGNVISSVMVCDESGSWKAADCRIGDDKKSLIISARGVKNPTGVSYCNENAPTASLFEQNGLPLAPFYLCWKS